MLWAVGGHFSRRKRLTRDSCKARLGCLNVFQDQCLPIKFLVIPRYFSKRLLPIPKPRHRPVTSFYQYCFQLRKKLAKLVLDVLSNSNHTATFCSVCTTVYQSSTNIDALRLNYRKTRPIHLIILKLAPTKESTEFPSCLSSVFISRIVLLQAFRQVFQAYSCNRVHAYIVTKARWKGNLVDCCNLEELSCSSWIL